MVHYDCRIAHSDYPTDNLGHPLGDATLNGVQQRLVFLEYYRLIDKGDKELVRIRRDWATEVHPVMLCSNTRCINPRHMVWARYHPKTRVSEWEYGGSGEIFRRMATRFEARKDEVRRREIQRIAMAKVQDIDTDLLEMTDEELLEVVSGQRKLRMDGSEKKVASKPRVQKTQEERLADQMKNFDALPLAEKIKLYEKLGGNLEDK